MVVTALNLGVLLYKCPSGAMMRHSSERIIKWVGLRTREYLLELASRVILISDGFIRSREGGTNN